MLIAFMLIRKRCSSVAVFFNIFISKFSSTMVKDFVRYILLLQM